MVLRAFFSLQFFSYSRPPATPGLQLLQTYSYSRSPATPGLQLLQSFGYTSGLQLLLPLSYSRPPALQAYSYSRPTATPDLQLLQPDHQLLQTCRYLYRRCCTHSCENWTAETWTMTWNGSCPQHLPTSEMRTESELSYAESYVTALHAWSWFCSACCVPACWTVNRPWIICFLVF